MFPPNWLVRVAHCASSANKILCVKHLLSFGSLQFLGHAQQSEPMHQTPVETLGPEHPMSFPGRQHSHTFPLVQEELGAPSVILLWKDSGERGLRFPLALALHAFPFCCFALQPFAVMNQLWVYNYKLSPLSRPSDSLNLEMNIIKN